LNGEAGGGSLGLQFVEGHPEPIGSTKIAIDSCLCPLSCQNPGCILTGERTSRYPSLHGSRTTCSSKVAALCDGCPRSGKLRLGADSGNTGTPERRICLLAYEVSLLSYVFDESEVASEMLLLLDKFCLTEETAPDGARTCLRRSLGLGCCSCPTTEGLTPECNFGLQRLVLAPDGFGSCLTSGSFLLGSYLSLSGFGFSLGGSTSIGFVRLPFGFLDAAEFR
jgi:hypothetical protein